MNSAEVSVSFSESESGIASDESVRLRTDVKLLKNKRYEKIPEKGAYRKRV